MSEEEYRKCPNCGGEIKLKAIKCKHCHSFLDSVDEPEDPLEFKSMNENFPPGEEIPPEPQETFQEPEHDFKTKSKGFFTALFDVNMTEMVTPKIIRVLYILGLVGIGLGMLTAIITAFIGIGTGGFGGVLITLITAPVGAFVAVIFLRVYLELIILLFNIYDQLKEIKAGVNRQ